MSVAVQVKANLQIHAVINITGLSDPTSRSTSSTTLLADGWSIHLRIPPTKSQDSKDYLGVWIYRPQELKNRYNVNVDIQLESLHNEKVYMISSIQWDLSASDLDLGKGWSEFYRWKKLWLDNVVTRNDGGFKVIVDIYTKQPTVVDPLALRIISQSMRGRDMIDVKFLLFTRRYAHDDKLGAQDPLPVYANSMFIKTKCNYFDDLLCSGKFSESNLVSFGPQPLHPSVDHYDYPSDSDLDYFSDNDDDEEDVYDQDRSNESKTVYDDTDNSGSKGSQDSTVKILQCSKAPEDKTTGNRIGRTVAPSPHTSTETSLDDVKSHRVGKVVPIMDCAYITWRAMMFYLYTSQIAFAPLSCHGLPRARTSAQKARSLPPRPSAKSMYCLADKLGLDELAKLSLEHIRSELSNDIIFAELFSAFTSRYKSVVDMELEYVFREWEELKNSSSLRDTLTEVTQGAFPHAADIVVSLVMHS